MRISKVRVLSLSLFLSLSLSLSLALSLFFLSLTHSLSLSLSPSLKAASAIDLEAKGYKCSNEKVFTELTDKVIQMYETQLVRHTTMIVGPTGGGKTLVLETLKNSRLTAENIVVKMHVLNPKAQPLNELYGEMDPVSRDWTDGILSKLFRELNERLPAGKENEVRWIVFDGDVDALWVENMNSVMDDNRLLTLPNGEHIRLVLLVTLIFVSFVW
jgi:dynein heavy chain